MAGHDRPPPELRLWLASAALPWSPKSALRLRTRALRETPCRLQALARLQAAETRMLARDAGTIRGADYPLPAPADTQRLGP